MAMLPNIVVIDMEAKDIGQYEGSDFEFGKLTAVVTQPDTFLEYLYIQLPVIPVAPYLDELARVLWKLVG